MLKGISKSYLLLLLTELLCVILLLPGCFQQSRLVHSFYGQDMTGMTVAGDGSREFCGDRMSLLPGVYEIRVQTRLSAGETMSVEMKSDDARYKSLLGNNVSVFSGNDDLTLSFWVLDKVSSAYVQCNFYDADSEALVSLEVYRTGKGNRVVLFLVLVIFVILDIMIEYRRRILAGMIPKKQQVVFWTLLGGVLLAYFPYMTNYFSIGVDTLFHLTRIAGLNETLEQGTSFPIRIQSYWNYGHGYAVSMFYGDLFLFLPAALMLIGFSLMTSFKIFILVLLAATAVIAYHSFYKCVKDEYAALFGSLFYLLIPYHLFNMYNRGAIGEFLAMTFLPLVVCGMYLLYTEDVKSSSYKKHKWYLVWGISAVLQSHMISTEMTVVFMLVFCVIFWKKTFRRETFLQLSEAAIIALLVNMWFWLPLLYMMNADVYHLQRITSEPGQNRGVSFANILQLLPNRGWAATGVYDSTPVQIGAGAFMLLVVYMLWRGRSRAQTWDRACKISAIFSVLTIVMSTRYLPWDAMMNIPGIGSIISSLQFPSRWMVLAALFAALFATFFFAAVKEAGGVLMKSALGIAAAIAVCSAVYHVNSIAFESGVVFLYEPNNMGTISMGFGEFLLEEVEIFGLNLYYHEPVADTGLEWSDYRKKGTDVDISLNNTSDRTLSVEIPLMGYKGYGIEVLSNEGIGTAIPYIAEAVGNHGDLKVDVPAGYQGAISISYQGFAIFHVAEVISVLSLVFVLGMFAYHRGKEIRDGIKIRKK